MKHWKLKQNSLLNREKISYVFIFLMGLFCLFGSSITLAESDENTTIDYSIHLENGFWQSIGTGEGVVNTFRGTGEIYVQSLNLQTFAGLLNRYLPKRS